MAMLNVNVHVDSRFNCRAPQYAGPGYKARAQTGTITTTTPHCHVEANVGTRGLSIDRTIYGLYEGHVPDAPVMLCQTQRYSEARAASGLTVRRVTSAVVACVLGGAAGAAAVGALGCTLAVGHVMLPVVFGPVYLPALVGLALAAASVSALWWLVIDQQQWSQAHRRFDVLNTMDGIATRVRAGTTTLQDTAWCNRIGSRHAISPDFILSQAALELMGLRREHGLSSTQQVG